jgi:hypothetical protein
MLAIMIRAIALMLSRRRRCARACARASAGSAGRECEIAAKDYDAAIAILEDFTAKNPQRGGAPERRASNHRDEPAAGRGLG